MNKIIGFSPLILLFFLACTIPSEADFQSESAPMSSEELVVIWRFPQHATMMEVPDTSDAYASRMNKAMKPLIEQLMPRMFSDLKDGKLTLYRQEDIGGLDEAKVSDLNDQLAKLPGTSWQNVSAFSHVFHLVERRKTTDRWFGKEALELEVIWQDPKGKRPERRLGAVRMADLVSLNYEIKLWDGSSVKLVEYLSSVIEFAYPIAYQTVEETHGLVSLEAAFATKEMLLNGQWDEIQWLGMMPNLSGFQPEKAEPTTLKALTGLYAFAPKQNNGLTSWGTETEVKIRFTEGHLTAHWSNQSPYFSYDIYPTKDGLYFTPAGDKIWFKRMEDGRTQLQIQQKDGRAAIGYRK
ncbi:MAG: hypothetical protein AAF206_04595 [Bacteroidota bacterium]